MHICSVNWQTTIVCNNADGAQMALVTTGIPLADKPLTDIPSPNNGCCPGTISGFLRMTYGRPSSPETLIPTFFPRRKMRLPRGH
jgi:hypothetical protein